MSDLVVAKGVSLFQLISGTYYEIGCATEVVFRYNNELINKTSVNSAGVREKVVRISDCRGSITGLVKTTNVDSVVSIFWYLSQGVNRASGTFKFAYTNEDGSIRTIIMDAIVESIEIRGNADSFAEFDLNIEGTGGFEMDTISPPTDPSASQIDSDTWTISGGLNYIEDTRLLNATIIEVDLEGTQYDATTGTPSGRKFKFTANIGGKGRVEFDSNVVINGQTVFVIWLY